MRVRIMSIIAGATLAMTAAPAIAQCGRVPCSTRVAVKGSSIIPADGEFAARGDIFSSQFTDVPVASNGFRTYNLGFTANFGSGAVNAVSIGENGVVVLGTSAAAVTRTANVASPTLPFVPVSDLRELGRSVIAPFYADLKQGAGSGNTRLDIGDVVLQYGLADPYADGGAYSRADARSAVRITWYGLDVDSNGGANNQRAAAQNAQVFAQLLISSDLNGASSFEFRYGPLASPGQAGYGSIAGFSLGANYLQFSGPYTDGIPTFFEFQNGKYVGQGAAPAVPEPMTWLLFILGFGLLGGALRIARRPRVARPA